MLKALKAVTKFFFYIISRIFITTTINSNIIFYTSQQQIAVDDEKLHYIKRKIVTLKEEILAPVLASLIN